jgi:cell division protein ZapA
VSQSKKSRTNVDIYGQMYVIVGEEEPSHIRMVANIVDKRMKELNEINPSLDTNKLAVLTAVNIVNEYAKLKSDHENLLQKHKREGQEEDD